jgi:hypothetical protein
MVKGGEPLSGCLVDTSDSRTKIRGLTAFHAILTALPAYLRGAR